VFVTARGRPFHGSTITMKFHRLLAEAGIKRIRFHDVRHGAATGMIASGSPIHAVADVLGHSTVSLTENRYRHAISAEVVDASERWAEVLRKRA
jgi:integrase